MDAQAYISLANDAINALTSIVMDPNNKFTKEHIAKIMPKTNNILGSIGQMAARMATLEGELSVYKNNPPVVTTTDSPHLQSNNVCEIIAEINEQNYREKNIIFCNIPESEALTRTDIMNNDTTSIKKIIFDLDSSTNSLDLKVYRIGKKDIHKPRGIKVEFPESKWPKILLGKKHSLKNNIRMYPDLSFAQRNQLNDLRDKLKNRQLSGEQDITIKYVNNHPTIVKLTPKN